jgi:hypothetical protein
MHSPASPVLNRDYVAVNTFIGDSAAAQAADQWAASITLMQHLLSTRSTRFLSIVQPNQWFRSGPQFRARAPSDEFTSRVMHSVPPGYRELVARIPSLKADGIAIRDETKLFEGQHDDIYADDCCHYSGVGNAMMLDVIAQWLRE